MRRLCVVSIVRLADEQDLPGMLEILNREIAVGFAHFGTEPQSLPDLEAEFRRSVRYPWMVAVIDGGIAGFARAHPWKNRGGYRHTCELGVYVRSGFKGRGIARALYEALLPELGSRGFHTILAGIALPNAASVHLHESMGFRHVGTLPQVGWKLGSWRDVGYWALLLEGSEPPTP